MIRVQVPATSANLGSGFDSLGIALSMHNRVWMEESDVVDISSRDSTVIPTDEHNLIYWAAKRLYEPVSYTHLLDGWQVYGKTGTTQDRKDLWFIGGTPYAVGGVWTGYASYKRQMDDEDIAKKIWKNIMSQYPVSYTHLDVYKRQGFGNRQGAAEFKT